jgi:phenylacetate-coenzyme A ligase PaaK-like adenylate-forming protein
MRQEIEKRLKIAAYDIYGLSEVIGLVYPVNAAKNQSPCI